MTFELLNLRRNKKSKFADSCNWWFLELTQRSHTKMQHESKIQNEKNFTLIHIDPADFLM